MDREGLERRRDISLGLLIVTVASRCCCKDRAMKCKRGKVKRSREWRGASGMEGSHRKLQQLEGGLNQAIGKNREGGRGKGDEGKSSRRPTPGKQTPASLHGL